MNPFYCREKRETFSTCAIIAFAAFRGRTFNPNDELTWMPCTELSRPPEKDRMYGLLLVGWRHVDFSSYILSISSCKASLDPKLLKRHNKRSLLERSLIYLNLDGACLGLELELDNVCDGRHSFCIAWLARGQIDEENTKKDCDCDHKAKRGLHLGVT